ncbi:MAG: iron-containing alcohol dehydrogenase [Planctomycetaceae bacterium]|jgi:alcohol dehydrogenase class IV|nr:iron-containing alcohol dehydrogenase [Planctomycetaceae bacterium]
MTVTEHPLRYDFVSPQQIVFGWGRRRELMQLAPRLGRRAFVVCGSRTLESAGLLGEIGELLASGGVEAIRLDTLTHEPEVDDVDRTSAELRKAGAGQGDFVLAVGGGAAIDLAKAVAVMATNTESPTIKDYLEGVGKGLTLVAEPLPVLAMPTTAGTGCEATKNAVISCYNPAFKKSIRDERIVPRIALVDPELTVSAPPSVTAASGMDAITQLFESYISRKAQPIPRALAVEGLRCALPAIGEAVRDGRSQSAREAMSHAAMLSGMCLANAGLGMAHGVAPALGVHCRVPHGAACALMLPVALRVNREARLHDLARLAHALGIKGPSSAPEDAVDALIAHVESICDDVGVPRRLSDLGVTADKIPALVASSRGSSMSGNPRELSDEDLTGILEGML